MDSKLGAAGPDLTVGGHETLREDGEFVLYRDRQRSSIDGLLHSTLVVAPVREHTDPRSLRRIENEYSLRAELDPAWAVRPLALSAYQGRLALVLEDPGGEPLGRLVGRPMELGQFLRLAIGLSGALARVHQHGLIHKDIKPANVLVNAATGQAWLMGFGIASRVPRERQSPEPPEFIAGTLAYMAPEQTGRMNRSIDSRSDLYSLGVTFYEMLTGGLPFTASDPMEWVHCHIARQPVTPGERVKEVPSPLSAIIVKLLAKTAEERYQTAAGVESDLRRCRAEWDARGRIDLFALGAHDTSDQLLMPEKLYGRDRERETLLAAFDQVVVTGIPALVLVSGYSGVGKSSIVHELHKVIVLPRGIFISGKFDQYKRDIPYATLAQAFRTLIRQILCESEADRIEHRSTPERRSLAELSYCVQRNFEVTNTVVFRRRQTPSPHVDLNRRQDEARYSQPGVACLSHRYELNLADTVVDVDITLALSFHRRFPAIFAAPFRQVVVTHEQARSAGKLENSPQRPKQLPCIATGKIRPRGAVIRHENRVADEYRVADYISDTRWRVARHVQNSDIQIADLERFAICK